MKKTTTISALTIKLQKLKAFKADQEIKLSALIASNAKPANINDACPIISVRLCIWKVKAGITRIENKLVKIS
jgi:hypothetical protein